MRPLWLSLALLLAACASGPLPYHPTSIDESSAHDTIQKTVMSQPEWRRPDTSYVDDRYFSLGEASSAGTPAAQADSQRIYYNSIDKVLLYAHGQGYQVQLVQADGRVIRSFALADQTQAERFIDALHYYRQRAPKGGLQ